MYRITPARSTPTKAPGTASRRPSKSASCCPGAKCRDVIFSLIEGICPPFELRQKLECCLLIMQPNMSLRRVPLAVCGEYHLGDNGWSGCRAVLASRRGVLCVPVTASNGDSRGGSYPRRRPTSPRSAALRWPARTTPVAGPRRRGPAPVPAAPRASPSPGSPSAARMQCNGKVDHVHLLIQYPPTVELTEQVNPRKGVPVQAAASAVLHPYASAAPVVAVTARRLVWWPTVVNHQRIHPGPEIQTNAGPPTHLRVHSRVQSAPVDALGAPATTSLKNQVCAT